MRTLAIRLLSASFAVACVGIAAASAATTTTLLPTDDVTLRGGVSADSNFNTDVTEALSTNASSTLDSQRRILLKFDTSTTPPARPSHQRSST